jgi:CheY-like chemotaxis protein
LVRLTAETLEGLGYATASFTSSLAAFEAFRNNPGGFDVVITDERMPFMSGATLTRKILGINQTVPVLLVSGNLSAAAIAEAHRAGVSQILKKPVRTRDLSSNLAQLLSQA